MKLWVLANDFFSNYQIDIYHANFFAKKYLLCHQIFFEHG